MAIAHSRRLRRDLIQLVGRTPENYAYELQEFLNEERMAREDGLPHPHEETHLVGGDDALAAPGAPSSILLGQAADTGDGPSYAREDHVHDTTALQTQIQDLADEALIFALFWDD